jgi:hypothetical protein
MVKERLILVFFLVVVLILLFLVFPEKLEITGKVTDTEIGDITGKQISDFEQPASAFRPPSSATKKVSLDPSDSCSISEIEWERSTVRLGETAEIFIYGNNYCNNNEIKINVYEKDFLFNQRVVALKGSFVQDKATLTLEIGEEFESLLNEAFEGDELEVYFKLNYNNEKYVSSLLSVVREFEENLFQPIGGDGPGDFVTKVVPIGYGGTTGFKIDRDGDGYGNGGQSPRDELPPYGQLDYLPSLGKDADDFDASINTPETARDKYGGLDSVGEFKQWIQDLTCLDIDGNTEQCYTHVLGDVFFMGPTGNDNTGQVNNPALPYRTIYPIKAHNSFGPGDVVIIREGYNSIDMGRFPNSPNWWPHYTQGLHLNDVVGTATQPILFIAAPGERAWFDGWYKALGFNPNSRYIIVDGIELNGKNMFGEYRKGGVFIETNIRDITLRNMEISRFLWNIFGSTNIKLQDITFDSLVIHDTQGGSGRGPEHGIYLNNAREGDFHTNVVIKDSLFYFVHRHAMQLRPPYRNLKIVRNIGHSNALRFIEFKGGLEDSEISNNLAFNNALMPFIINLESQRYGHAGPNSRANTFGVAPDNVKIFQNTFWLGRFTNEIGDSCWRSQGGGCNVQPPNGDTATAFHQTGIGNHTLADPIYFPVWSLTDFINIQIVNNVIHTTGGSMIRTDWLPNMVTAVIQKNFLYSDAQYPGMDSSWCLKLPDDGTHSHSTSVGSCLKYWWTMSALEHPNRPGVKDNEFLGFNDLGNLFRDVREDYNYNPEKFDFNPVGQSLATDNILPGYTSLRDIRGNLRGANQDAGAYEYLPALVSKPVLNSISPPGVLPDSTTSLLLKGHNFVDGPSLELEICYVDMECTIIPNSPGVIQFNSAQELGFTFNVYGHPTGPYGFRVKNPNGEYSNRVFVYVQGLPLEPEGLTLSSLSYGRIGLSWNDLSDNELSFQIQRKEPAGDWEIIRAVAENEKSYVDYLTSSGITYEYQIRAVNFAGESDWVGAEAIPVPDVPTGLKVDSVTLSQVDLSWNDNSNNENGFYIERSLSQTSGFEQIGTTNTNEITFIDNTVSHSTTYYYKVSAFNSGGNSGDSNVVTAVIPVPPICSSQGGEICSLGFYCAETELIHSGTGVCCNEVCSEGIGGLVGHWKFDDFLDDFQSTDSSKNNLHGTCSSGDCPNFLSSGGYLNGAYDFDGINDEIVVLDNNLLDLSTEGTTMAWVNRDNVNKWHGIITKGDTPLQNSPSQISYDMEITPSGKFKCRLGDQDYFLNFVTLADGVYYHVVCSWSINNLDIYIDGDLKTSILTSTISPVSTGNLHIGTWPAHGTTTWDWMDGRIDDVRIYNRALNEQEIQYIFNSGTSTSPIAPDNLQVSVPVAPRGRTELDLAWNDNSNDETGFEIQRSSSLTNWVWNTIATAPASNAVTGSYTDDNSGAGLQSGTLYQYRIRAVNSGGNSVWHPVVQPYSSRTTLESPPSPPEDLVATVQSSSVVHLTWEDTSNNENGFWLGRRQGNSGGFSGVPGATSLPEGTEQFTDTGLTPETYYEYRVYSYNSALPNGPSNIAFVTTFVCDPGTQTSCAQLLGVCSGTLNTCQSSGVWSGCNYQANAQTNFEVNYESGTELSCQDGFDNDCDGEGDADGTTPGSSHGDVDCLVSITGISATSPVATSSQFDLTCTSNVGDIRSVRGLIDGDLCSFVSWNGLNSEFICVSSNSAGNQVAKCDVNPVYSYAGTPPEMTQNVNVFSQGDCSQYTSQGQDACNLAPEGCEWSEGCFGTQSNGQGNICVPTGTSGSYMCMATGLYTCSAECDGTSGGCSQSAICNLNSCGCEEKSPSITGISPSSFAWSSNGITITINGEYFASDAVLDIGNVVVPNNRLTIAPNSITFDYVAGEFSSGTHNVKVRNPTSGLESSEIRILTLSSNPVINLIDPDTVLNNQNNIVQINGNDFDPVNIKFNGLVITSELGTWNLIDYTLIELNLNSGIEGGDYNVSVENNDLSESNEKEFRINYPFNYHISFDVSGVSAARGSSFEAIVTLESDEFMEHEEVVLSLEDSSAEITSEFVGSDRCIPFPSCYITLSINVGEIESNRDYSVDVLGVSSETGVEKENTLLINRESSSSGSGSSGGGGGGGSRRSKTSGTTGNVSFNAPQCDDGIDNDGDGLIDFPEDLGCTSHSDNSEVNVGTLIGFNTTFGEELEEEISEDGKDIEIRPVFWIVLSVLVIGIIVVLLLILNTLRRHKKFKKRHR